MKLNGDLIVGVALTAVLGIIGYFLAQTCSSLRGLEKDVVTIREKITALETSRITRADIKEMIKEYHSTHPCIKGVEQGTMK
jgi:hypothetical protein